eukprot:6468046-Amphidinium_carterae.1
MTETGCGEFRASAEDETGDVIELPWKLWQTENVVTWELRRPMARVCGKRQKLALHQLIADELKVWKLFVLQYRGELHLLPSLKSWRETRGKEAEVPELVKAEWSVTSCAL